MWHLHNPPSPPRHRPSPSLPQWGDLSLLCLVFDLTSEQSFANCSHWMERVRAHCQGRHVPGESSKGQSIWGAPSEMVNSRSRSQFSARVKLLPDSTVSWPLTFLLVPQFLPEFAQIFHYSLCEGCSRRVISGRAVKWLHGTRALRLILVLL